MRFLRRSVLSSIAVWSCAVSSQAQSAAPGGMQEASPTTASVQVELVVPTGTPLRVALQERVRIKHPEQPVTAMLTKTVYAFDKAVIPAGSEVYGRITRIEPVPRKKRILAFANGNFTPQPTYGIAFDSLILLDGTRIPIEVQVSPGEAEVIHLVSNTEREKKKNVAARTAVIAKKEVSDTVHAASASIKSPGQFGRIKQYVVAQLPFRRHYLEPGTRFNAALEKPLDFGAITRTAEDLSSLGTLPEEGSLLEAWLTDELSSATAKQGTPVEATVAVPLFSSEQKLVVPANSKLVGEVVQTRPAGKLHHNGRLRVALQRIELPDGAARPVRANLESVEVDRAAGLKLDAEGGVQASDGKSRYVSTGLAIAIAVMAAQPDQPDPGEVPTSDPSVRAAGGGSGLRVVGAVAGLAVRSQIFYGALAGYGAARSIHSHFLSRGRDVTFPKGTPLEIGFAEPRQELDKAER